MKRVKILTILFICLFAFNIKADNGSHVNINVDDNGISVFDDDGEDLLDYSEYVEYNNDTLLLKKDINNFSASNTSFTLTTNNNKIRINEMHLVGSSKYKFNIVSSNIEFDRAYADNVHYADVEHSSSAVSFSDYIINITNSSINSNTPILVLYGKTFNISNSNIDVFSIGSNVYNCRNIITNSTITVKKNWAKTYLDNTLFKISELSGSIFATNTSKIINYQGGKMIHLFLDNSEFEYTYLDQSYESIEIQGRLSVHNSKISLDFEKSRRNPPTFVFDDDNYEFDDDMMFIDSNGNLLHKITYPSGGKCSKSMNPSIMEEDYPDHTCQSFTAATYVLGEENSTPKSLSIASVVEVRFKVKGTWADGTTDDIVIYKPAFSTISYTDIPVGKMTLDDFENGNWDTKPVNAVLKENKDVVLTLTISNIKGLEENPKTGLFNDILLFIPVIISILGFNYLKRLELFKKM